MKIRNYIKVNAEKIPFLMMCFFSICFLCSSLDFYFYGYELMQNICEVSLLFCIFMYGYSEKWSFVSRRSLNTLFVLNLLNIVHEIFPLLNYYFYYNVFIYSLFITIIIYSKWKKP